MVSVTGPKVCDLAGIKPAIVVASNATSV